MSEVKPTLAVDVVMAVKLALAVRPLGNAEEILDVIADITFADWFPTEPEAPTRLLVESVQRVRRQREGE